MTASIRIDDGTNPPQQSTDNPVTFLGTVHTLSNFDDTNILAWLWTLVDKPIGSAAALSATTTATTTLTPDVEGSYLVRLETFLDVGGTNADDVDEQVIGVRFEDPFNWLIPAAGETTQQGVRGWAQSREEAIRELRKNLLPQPGTVVTAGPYTATVGELVFYDPSGGTFIINSPSSPVLGDRWAVKNVTTDTTSVTISSTEPIEDPNTSTFLGSFGLALALVSLDYVFDGTNWVIV